MIALKLIAADLRRMWLATIILVLLIAVATALVLALRIGERALVQATGRAAERFDIIVGAPGSEVDLTLSSLLLRREPLAGLHPQIVEQLLADKRATSVAPLIFGERFRGMPIIGTTAAFATDGGRIKLAAGRIFMAPGEAVVGARSPVGPNELVTLSPDDRRRGPGVKGLNSYTIVGRLNWTGTPWDRAVLVPLESFWQKRDVGPWSPDEDVIGEAPPRLVMTTAGEGSARVGALAPPPSLQPWTRPLRNVGAVALRARSPADAQSLKESYNSDVAMAILPKEEIEALRGTFANLQAALNIIALGGLGSVAVAIVLVAISHLDHRRGQISAYRTLGVSSASIFRLVWAQLVTIVAFGLCLGVVLGYVAALLLGDFFTLSTALVLPVSLQMADAPLLTTLALGGAVLAAIPALIAARRPIIAAPRL
ncbi:MULTISPECIES: FtsX-like permease family protein [unclassified Chelatococcus]|uniref:FtsX-like permease family protein n=1 Tax=unclassified Chelatococcus TaxID=2638111 RepID=UPI001BCFE312|nr:FtsX-like permease family protein [Chelatococcus sp.]MBS7738071.1 FtsX-like permease family protein [Chelatococcus sp. HY11]CAH1667785.1 putative ABC transport system permease protein [Hyphomicrobiales bacterium]MBX3546290.1 FtsX-like permease family protein [Chelatococcus sp.]MCO5077584.1 FtsX-like permease family protein [Chelatococcus sp.]CAH1679402.1 putative ABC transport system permease protein [Hyphomicrobiales bacterium]